MNEAEIIIARWDDWVLLQDAVCEVIARVGRKHALGLALINHSLHNEQLELALLAPDGITLTIFSRTECKCRTIYAPLNPLEGTRIEPYEAGQHYVRGVVKLTSPATATPPADRQLPAANGPEPSQSSQSQRQPRQPPPAAQPDEPAITNPASASASAADAGDQGTAAAAAPISKLDAWVAKHGPALAGNQPKEGWNKFYDSCRDDCDGWADKKNGKPAAGFSNKTIERRLQHAGFK